MSTSEAVFGIAEEFAAKMSTVNWGSLGSSATAMLTLTDCAMVIPVGETAEMALMKSKLPPTLGLMKLAIVT